MKTIQSLRRPASLCVGNDTIPQRLHTKLWEWYLNLRGTRFSHLSSRSFGSGLYTYHNNFISMQFVPDPRFEEVKAYVRSGVFGPYNYEELMGSLEGNEGYGRADYFLVGKDFPSYIECQEKVDEAYRNQNVSSQSITFFFINSFRQ